MVELLVMRHAKSDWDTGAATDFLRPLAPRGHADAERMTAWLREQNLEPDLILCSSAVRAAQTVQYVIDEFAIDASRIEARDDLYLAGPWEWCAALGDQVADRVLICGHNPGLDDLVELLDPADTPVTPGGKLMTTAAIAHFRIRGGWEAIGSNAGALLTLKRPRELD